MNYISLFSGAGVGCFGFKQENFHCIATNEILEKRLDVQKINKISSSDDAYILGDIRNKDIKDKIYSKVRHDLEKRYIDEIDLIVSTPPCQGISVANLKKRDEIVRNSLVVTSIEIIRDLKPKFFVFENVRSFMKTICTDLDGNNKTIEESIAVNLGGMYNFFSKVINFKDYGAYSSRTRTIVIGSRIDLEEITPVDIFPDKSGVKTLKEIIGYLPSLKNMGVIDKNDVFHHFKPYPVQMESWISDLKEGESAFDNSDPSKIPHRVINGEYVRNIKKNGDKYKRSMWDKVGPCVHTRNDILASQNTVHPKDNRVFSIRELMLMMNIPKTFRWLEQSENQINKLSFEEKTKLLKKNQFKIRQSIGEAVPTVIFNSIGKKIKKLYKRKSLSVFQIKQLIKVEKLYESENLLTFLKKKSKEFHLSSLLKLVELANENRKENSAFSTRQDLCFDLINKLPEFKNRKNIKILEPSVGFGNFLPLIFSKYENNDSVELDVIDIDPHVMKILGELIKLFKVPSNFKINLKCKDYLLESRKKYDLIIGNPPFGKVEKNKRLLKLYKTKVVNNKSNNIFSFFLEKALLESTNVCFILPKSFLSSPEFEATRKIVSNKNIELIIDHGEKGFKGVLIETIGILINNKKNPRVDIKSYINNTYRIVDQNYIISSEFPNWLLYRNRVFDSVSRNMEFNIFTVFRDRIITKKHTAPEGKFRVIKSRNIGNLELINIQGYDSYINEINELSVSKYLNKTDCVIIPNLTYYPRATWLPENSIADGSVAILEPIGANNISDKDLAYYSSEEFTQFYKICRNLGTRSLNIDKNSVFYFGIKKNGLHVNR